VIKGFDKPNFCEVFSKITTYNGADLPAEYLKNNLDLIFTV